MRLPPKRVLLAATSLSLLGCAGGGGGDSPGGDPALEALVACTAARLPDVGDLLRKLYPCLHVVDTNAPHPGCSWVPIRCTPIADPQNPVSCPDGAGTFTLTTRFGSIGAKVIPGLYRGGPSFSECWNGVGTGESCGFDWSVLQPGNAIAASGGMSFVELSPDAHVVSLARQEPRFEADGCRLQVTNLGVYLALENLEWQQGPVVTSAQLGFEVSRPPDPEVLSGFTLFGDSGTAGLDLTYRGARWQVQIDARTFQVIP